MAGSYPSIVAVDLGAESCRVSLLQWHGDQPEIRLVHRFPNAPVHADGALRWNLDLILSEVDAGLRRCAEIAAHPIQSIGADGWAVDYVRLGPDGHPSGAPFCYRDTRTEAAFRQVEQRISKQELFAIAGAQPLRINTLYQLVADNFAGIPAGAPWVNLPEYLLSHLGARVVAEHTNAAHTGMQDVRTRQWSEEIFRRCGLELSAAPEMVPTGCEIGAVKGAIASLAALDGTRLIAPACHDTAAAVAGIPAEGDDWAYISSGTWSLVGTLLNAPVTTRESREAGFTNFAGAGGRICFHKNVNGMWLLKECMRQLCGEEDAWTIPDLIAAAEKLAAPEQVLDLDDDSLLLAGGMASRMNAQRRRMGLPSIEERAASMPHYANLIFHSLAQQYAGVLSKLSTLTGKQLRRIFIVGGGSRNAFLNRLTSEATGLPVQRGFAESSTFGNLSIQLATLEGEANSPGRIAHWARILERGRYC
jgi:rhamnulokinase